MTRRWPVAGVVFAVLWVFVRGPELGVEPVVGELLFGLVVGVPVAFVFRRLYDEGFDHRRTLRSIPYAGLYLVTFAREVVVGNVDVTYRVLAPSQPIEPEVILIPLRVRTDVGVTTIANSITITPGTITLDYDEQQNALYVHVIDGRDPEAIVAPIRKWEDYALEIFDEELSQGDPAPDFAVYPPDQTHPVLQPAASESDESETTEAEGADAAEGGESDGAEQEESDGAEQEESDGAASERPSTPGGEDDGN